MATKFGRVVTCDGGTPPSKLCDLLITWSSANEKNLYLNFHNTYGHETWQSGNLWSEDTTHTKLHDLLITWSRDKYKTFNLQVGGPNPPSHVIV